MDNFGIGLLGTGTVGSEVARRLIDVRSSHALSQRAGRNLQLRGIFTRNPQGKKSADIYENHSTIFRRSPEEIINSPSVHLIVETLGGTDEALRVIEMALNAGKHVVTANKALLSQKGAHLFELAGRNNVRIGMEASVMGGIPVINGLTTGLAGDEIQGLVGIANGTTNYMLTQMKNHGLSYEEALKEAQDLGYAERDPTDDVKGYDAAYKASLLAFLAFGKDVKIGEFNLVEGIDALDAIDFQYLEDLNAKVKLLAIAEKTSNGTLTLMVAPHVLDRNHPLAQVDGARNAIEITGREKGAPNVMTGKGAGGIATSNSALSDVVRIAGGGGRIWIPKEGQYMSLTQPEDITGEYYLRVTTSNDVPGILGRVATCLGQHDINIEQTRQLRGPDGTGLNIPFVVTTSITNKATMDKVVAEIRQMENIGGVMSMRILKN